MAVLLPTFRGKTIDPFNVKASDIYLEDIAYGLAHTYRYGGHLSPGITVAEHCVLVSRLVEAQHQGHPSLAALKKAALLHDASEAYLHDIQAPLRPYVFVKEPDGSLTPWSELDLRITAVVCEAYQVDPLLLTAPEVTSADSEAVTFEVLHSKNLRHIRPDAEIPPHLASLAPRFLSSQEAWVQYLHRAHAILL